MQARSWIAGATIVGALALPMQAFAQEAGGTLRAYHRGTPPSGSIHEEATSSTVQPYMSVFNNLVMYDQSIAKNSLDSIVPDLATEWSWNGDGTALTFKLREGVKWHDGKPFTANDVKCTWDLLQGKSKARLRKNPRKSWYWNLKEVTADNDFQATFHLGQPQPALLALLASGYSPVYPCHVAPKQMRTNPVGTGPFKFVQLKQNESIKFVRNDDYWKKDRPYLEAVDWTIIRSRSTRILAFVADEFDMTFVGDVSVPLMKDVAAQAPDAVCHKVTTNVSTNLIVNFDSPPFDNPNVRLAMATAMDRDAFITILHGGEAQKGGAMLPPPNGGWGMPEDVLKAAPGYGDPAADVKKAQALMQAEGYGPDNRVSIKVSTRNIAIYRDPAVILIDQLKQIYIDAELDVIETSNWHAKVARKDYQVGLNLTGVGVDDPDVVFFENYACGSQRNYTGYCNQDMMELFKKQSSMTDQDARRKLVWEIDARLQADGARPMIDHRVGATCVQPRVQGFVNMVNSTYNGWRMEDLWLKK